MIKFYEGLKVLRKSANCDIVTLKTVYNSAVRAEIKLHRLVNKLEVHKWMLTESAYNELNKMYNETLTEVSEEKNRLMEMLGLDIEENTYVESSVIYDINNEVDDHFNSDLDIIRALQDNTDLTMDEYKATLTTYDYCTYTLREIEAYRKEKLKLGEKTKKQDV